MAYHDDKEGLRRYTAIMEDWRLVVISHAPPDFTSLIDIRDAVAVLEGRAWCIWDHSSGCPRTAMERLVPNWTGQLAISVISDADLATL